MEIEDFDSATQKIQDQIIQEIESLGKLWESSQKCISTDVLNSWDDLISEWIEDESMPLIIRKSSCRGQEFIHEETGRRIIVSDNAFAVWVYRKVLEGKTYSLSEIKNKLLNNEIPIVYVISKIDKEKAKYTTLLGKDAISVVGNKWKLCHIDPVGLGTREKIEKIDIKRIKNRFERYVNPKNMFLLPQGIGGLGEVEEFIKEQRIDRKATLHAPDVELPDKRQKRQSSR